MAPAKGIMGSEMGAGLPPAKQMQSEESLPALDDQERKAVQTRARQKLMGGAGNVFSARSSGSKTPKTGSSRLPGYMTPKTGGSRSSRRSPQSSRSSIVTNRTSSPTGRYHPDPERRLEIRKVRRCTSLRALPAPPCTVRRLTHARKSAAPAPELQPPFSAVRSRARGARSAGGPEREHRLPRAQRRPRQRPQGQGEQLAREPSLY